MTVSKDTAHWLVALIIACYLILGTLYAWQTPKWQTPDEPAHFNYIEYIAREKRLPVLQFGDYPHQYLEEIKAARFPPYMSITPIRYEFHQPPLYYALGATLYLLTAGLGFDLQFLALRLLSVALGAIGLWVVYRLVQDIVPDAKFLALAATAFVAVIPMHLAMTAAINNDALAELLLLLILYQSIHVIQKGIDNRRTVVTGILVGLALLTKTTIYMALGVIVITALLGKRPSCTFAEVIPGEDGTLFRWRTPAKVRFLFSVFAVALLLAVPLFVRNALVYGGLDILGWQRHDTVVAGQLRTADLLAQVGPTNLIIQLVLTTFRSFWAQFGWMGVLVDERIYLLLALLSGLLGLGLLISIIRVWQGQSRLTQAQRGGLRLLAASATFSVLTYLGYNLKFVQYQGRYLFPALGPLALATALSLWEILQPRTARPLAIGLALVSLLFLVHGMLSGHVPGWGLVLLVAGAAFLAVAGWLPHRWRWLPPALLYLAFLVLDWVCLFVYIVPYLRWPGR